MPPRSAPSAALVRAARTEDERIARELQRLDRRRDALRAELAEVDRDVSALRERRRLLEALADGNERGAPDAAAATAPRLLRGRDLRRVAGTVLWRASGEGEIQYRDWFELVLAAGYAIGGKDPIAAFLTNVRGSPAVVRGSEPGYYRLDPRRRDAVRQAMAEAQAELRDVVGLLGREREAESLDRRAQLREHRRALTVAVRRLEADLDELDTIFDQGPARAHPRAA